MSTINPKLTHYLVADGGLWGRGATIAEAKKNRPGGALSKNARWYRCGPRTEIGDGKFINVTKDTRPVAVDIKTGEPLDE